jgi:anti-sigma regulatory factor (Ser/Thr protein kinase)
MRATFEYPAHIQSLPHIRKEVEIIGKDWVLPDSEQKQIRVIIEELFSHIIEAGSKAVAATYFQVRISMEKPMISIRISYDGVGFNPMSPGPLPAEDPASLDDGDGGMGLKLIRTFCDSVSYYINGGMNNLSIEKRIRSGYSY